MMKTNSFKEFFEFINPKIHIPTIEILKKNLKDIGDTSLLQSIDQETKFSVIIDGWKNILNPNTINIAIKDEHDIIFLESVYMYDNETSFNLV